MIHNGSAIIKGLLRNKDILGVQTDATLDPGASPATGARYIVTDTAALNANFGTITGVGNNDIVEYDGSDFVVKYDASAGECDDAKVWDRASDTWYAYEGSAWAFISSVGTLGDLTDVTDSATLDGEILVYNGSSWQSAGVSGDLEIDSTGSATIPADTIDAARLQTDSVTEVKIQDGAVATAKIANDAVDVDKLDFASTGLRSVADTGWTAAALTHTVNHAFATNFVKVECYDATTGETFIPDSVDRSDTNNVVVSVAEGPASNGDYVVLVTEAVARS